MPKEVVYGERLRFDDVPEDRWEQPVVVVAWSREHGDVHLVTRLSDAEAPTPEEEANIPAKYGFHVWLDRQAVNDLIRHLRRARDQAFGRDE